MGGADDLSRKENVPANRNSFRSLIPNHVALAMAMLGLVVGSTAPVSVWLFYMDYIYIVFLVFLIFLFRTWPRTGPQPSHHLIRLGNHVQSSSRLA